MNRETRDSQWDCTNRSGYIRDQSCDRLVRGLAGVWQEFCAGVLHRSLAGVLQGGFCREFYVLYRAFTTCAMFVMTWPGVYFFFTTFRLTYHTTLAVWSYQILLSIQVKRGAWHEAERTTYIKSTYRNLAIVTMTWYIAVWVLIVSPNVTLGTCSFITICLFLPKSISASYSQLTLSSTFLCGVYYSC